MANTPILRYAMRHDAATIAELHTASWMTAYRGLLSDEYLDNDLAGERLTYWSNKVNVLKDGEFIILATDQDGVALGFIAVMDQPDATFRNLVDNLHVRPDLKGRGIGKTLMQHAARVLTDAGQTSYYLWVLNGNDPAMRFYESIGGVAADERTVHFGGKDVKATRFVWSDFHRLLA